MPKVRRGHEDIFIAQVTDADSISEKFHFDFDNKWKVNSRDTRRIAVGKIKTDPINLTDEEGLAIDNVEDTQLHRLIGNQQITDLLIHIASEKRWFIDNLYPHIFPSPICYL
jgi:hypothetical protein